MSTGWPAAIGSDHKSRGCPWWLSWASFICDLDAYSHVIVSIVPTHYKVKVYNFIRCLQMFITTMTPGGCQHYPSYPITVKSWWRHQMETFSALLALCAGNSPVTGEFHTQKPVTRTFDISFGLRLNKRLSKQSWGWWSETPSRTLWRHCNALM